MLQASLSTEKLSIRLKGIWSYQRAYTTDSHNPKCWRWRNTLVYQNNLGGRKMRCFNTSRTMLFSVLRDEKIVFSSQVDKELLIKSKALVMPVFSMNRFQIPVDLCSNIDNLVSHFWYGTINDMKRMAWIAWKKIINFQTGWWTWISGFTSVQSSSSW